MEYGCYSINNIRNENFYFKNKSVIPFFLLKHVYKFLGNKIISLVIV